MRLDAEGDENLGIATSHIERVYVVLLVQHTVNAEVIVFVANPKINIQALCFTYDGHVRFEGRKHARTMMKELVSVRAGIGRHRGEWVLSMT